MNEEYRTQLADSVLYFWNNYEDLERSSQWDEVKAEFPELAIAWANFKAAKRIVELEVRNLQ